MGGYGTIYLFCWPQWDKIIWVLYNLQINILLDFFQSYCPYIKSFTGSAEFDKSFSQWNQYIHTPLITKIALKMFLNFVRQHRWKKITLWRLPKALFTSISYLSSSVEPSKNIHHIKYCYNTRASQNVIQEGTNFGCLLCIISQKTSW